jgi:hypothetical protein
MGEEPGVLDDTLVEIEPVALRKPVEAELTPIQYLPDPLFLICSVASGEWTTAASPVPGRFQTVCSAL